MTELTPPKDPYKYLSIANIREKEKLYKLKDYGGTRINYPKLVMNIFIEWFLNNQSIKFFNYFPSSIVRTRKYITIENVLDDLLKVLYEVTTCNS